MLLGVWLKMQKYSLLGAGSAEATERSRTQHLGRKGPDYRRLGEPEGAKNNSFGWNDC